MRNTFLFVAVLLLVGGAAFADRATYDNTKTQVALPLSTPPVIDGVIDFNTEPWNYAGSATGGSSNWRITVNAANDAEGDTVRGGSITSGVAPVDSNDLSYYVWAGYDSNYLYVAVRVIDSDIQTNNAAAGSANGSTWTDDSVEVFVDGDNSNFPTSDTTGTNPEVVGTGGQFVITANNAYREAEAGNPGYGKDKAWYALTSLTDTGYDAEFRISLKTLGNPKPGDIIGFTVGVNDSDSDGTTKQVIWCGKTHTEATYGNLLLGPRTYTAPKAAKAPKIDGKIDTNEYAGAPTISIDTHTGSYDLEAGDDSWPEGDHSYKAWVIHDAQAIYVAFDVIDDIISTDTAAVGSEDGSTWEDDSVEIFFDTDNDKSLLAMNSTDGLSASVPNEGQYVITANGAVRDNEANNPTFGETGDWFGVASLTAKGYQVEFLVKKAILSNPKDDTSIGFDLDLNDDDGSGRKCQLVWQGRAHFEPTYGTLTLSSKGGTSISEWSLF